MKREIVADDRWEIVADDRNGSKTDGLVEMGELVCSRMRWGKKIEDLTITEKLGETSDSLGFDNVFDLSGSVFGLSEVATPTPSFQVQ